MRAKPPPTRKVMTILPRIAERDARTAPFWSDRRGLFS